MKANEIDKSCESINNKLQDLYRKLSQIRMALQSVENTKENDYSYLEDMTDEQKEVYINRELLYAEERAALSIKNALMGILRKSNEITNKALEMIEEEIEF